MQFVEAVYEPGVMNQFAERDNLQLVQRIGRERGAENYPADDLVAG
jgi:hypothetical protein